MTAVVICLSTVVLAALGVLAYVAFQLQKTATEAFSHLKAQTITEKVNADVIKNHSSAQLKVMSNLAKKPRRNLDEPDLPTGHLNVNGRILEPVTPEDLLAEIENARI
jgi:hypothetical protein